MLAHLIPMAQALILNVVRLCVWLVILTVIFVPLERLFALQGKALRRHEIASDLAYYFLNSLVPAFIIAVPMSVLATILRHVTPQTYLDAVGALPIGAKIPIALFVSELGGYWAHRLMHENPVLWRFHSVHHAPTHIDWLVNTRAHPVDIVISRLCALAPLYILGLAGVGAEGGNLAAIVTIIGVAWAFFIHADVRWRFGPLEELISTPAFHHWHHTNDEHRDRNYAALLPFVDRMFGTFYLPREWPPAYGIDQPIGKTLGEQLIDPLIGGPARPPAV